MRRLIVLVILVAGAGVLVSGCREKGPLERAGEKADRAITVAFENPARTVQLPLYENDLELAYALTCHKFQGSEAQIIVVPVHKSFGPLIMQRNWLYTALSRAREVCIVVGQREQIPLIIRRNRQQRRYTGLAEALR